MRDSVEFVETYLTGTASLIRMKRGIGAGINVFTDCAERGGMFLQRLADTGNRRSQMRLLVFVALLMAGAGCNRLGSGGNIKQNEGSLVEARKGFQSRLVSRSNAREPLDQPPAGAFRLIHYDAAPGKLAAYLTPDPQDKKKHPAIIWITG